MLVLSRKTGESIVINDDIRVVVVSLDGNRCRLGIVAPQSVPVHREEIYERVRADQEAPSTLTFTGRTTGNNSLATELDAAHTAEFRGHDLFLDFTNVRVVSSDDLGALVKLNKQCLSRGAHLTLIRLTDLVREVFAITRLDSLLTIRDGP